MNGRTDRRTNGQTDGRTEGQIDRQDESVWVPLFAIWLQNPINDALYIVRRRK